MRRSFFIDSYLVGLLAVLFLATLPVALMMSGPAQAGRPALVVVPPWTDDPGRIIAAAGGREIGLVAAPMARLAVLERPAEAVAGGAWAVLDATALASLCGSKGG
ncbi:hypothetical protein XM53_05540 [Roseovarius atlanticus]|uniref:Uncharacterized protein n=1 Tax=Roseovarius atlanticus TaxID=1641875 RepID=A0A0T5NYT0_9RHOB|nr:hypothetical protein [Roseovarius atlanticus]KRS14000.1 hypothetical protein XM53_05540 [Roseovarius atlanticus]